MPRLVNEDNSMNRSKARVVIVGGGFAGLQAAIQLGKRDISTILFDKTNYHLFQPLLYQVATGSLSQSEIAAPLRSVLSRYKSVQVIQSEVVNVDLQKAFIETEDNRVSYDYFVLATGVTHSYFGHDQWEQFAPGLKTLEDAALVRNQVLGAFEAAERCADPELQKRYLTFAIVGGGPTGVELASAIAELARSTLRQEFRNFDSRAAQILLFEGGERILPTFRPQSSQYAKEVLKHLGVNVYTKTFVTDLSEGTLQIIKEGVEKATIYANTIIWAAGVKAATLGKIVSATSGVETDTLGRIKVNHDLALPQFPNVFVIGDLAHCKDGKGEPLPGIAPVAIQEGKHVARVIAASIDNKKRKPFRYHDKGVMAVIGRGRAVVESHALRLQGFIAWILWAIVHIYFLIEFENKMIVFFRWAWNYLTNKRGSRLLFPRKKASNKNGSLPKT